MAAVIFVTAAVVVIAEYTKSTYEKKVIVSANSDLLFSSNVLRPAGTDPNITSIDVSSTSIASVAEVTVCNYSQNDIGVASLSDITYDLTAKLKKKTVSGETVTYSDAAAADVGDVQFIVTKKGVGSTPDESHTLGSVSGSKVLEYTFSGITLTGGASKSTTFTVDIPSLSDNADIFVELIASPTSGAVTTSLEGVFNVEYVAPVVSHTWAGSFSDTDMDTKTPPAYDAFNYAIAGSGAGDFVLMWNADYLDISAYFTNIEAIQGLSLSPTPVPVDCEAPSGKAAGNWKSFTFPVDSDRVSRYVVQFFRKSGDGYSDDNYQTWVQLNSYVHFVPPADS